MKEDNGLICETIEKKEKEYDIPAIKAQNSIKNSAFESAISEAENLYQEAEKIFRESLKMISFDKAEERVKFLDSMANRRFGRFIEILKSPAGLLWLKIGEHCLGPHYLPKKEHIEKIKEVLETQANYQEAVEEIRQQFGVILETARRLRRNILYPEFEELEAQIASLKERIKEKDKQLRFSLDTWLMLMQEIDSSLRRANSRIYAMKNEIGKED